MTPIEFEWDPGKERSNRRKHGVSFEEAKAAFFDENARLIADPDASAGEERYLLLGLSAALRALVVCHCWRRADSVIRIISARKATRSEREQYQERSR